MKYLKTYENLVPKKPKLSPYAQVYQNKIYILVKRKKDNAIGRLENTTTKNWSTIYQIDFGDGIKEYSNKEIESPTSDEVEFYLNVNKYNL